MTSTRRETLGLGLASAASIALPAGVARAGLPVCAPDSAGRAPHWGSGVEGQRIADLGDGRFLNPVLAGDRPDPNIFAAPRARRPAT